MRKVLAWTGALAQRLAQKIGTMVLCLALISKPLTLFLLPPKMAVGGFVITIHLQEQEQKHTHGLQRLLPHFGG
jgi:hypothetical protein